MRVILHQFEDGPVRPQTVVTRLGLDWIQARWAARARKAAAERAQAEADARTRRLPGI